MTYEDIKSLVGDFTWDFGNKFFIETSEGNFVWSDPDYYGDNTIVKFNGSYKEFFGESYGRSKGNHTIASFCGEHCKFIES